MEPDLWGVLGPLPDDGKPAYVNITPLHLAASYSFIGVLRTEFDSALTSLSTEVDALDDLCQETAAEADVDYCRIRARGACFLPSDLVGALYNLGARLTIAKVPPQLFVMILALGKDTPRVRERSRLGPDLLYQGGLEEPPLLVLS